MKILHCMKNEFLEASTIIVPPVLSDASSSENMNKNKNNNKKRKVSLDAADQDPIQVMNDSNLANNKENQVRSPKRLLTL